MEGWVSHCSCVMLEWPSQGGSIYLVEGGYYRTGEENGIEDHQIGRSTSLLKRTRRVEGWRALGKFQQRAGPAEKQG